MRYVRFLPFLVFFLLFMTAVPGLAASDPSIRDWGSPPGTPPPYQTPDIWVDNDGNGVQGVGEPSKGLVNRLFAKVRNLGTTPASEVEVTFAYAPYGMWGWSSYPQFKPIQTVNVPNLAAAGSPGDERTIEVQWDLTDLTEDNGGVWGGYAVGDFDHFCVWVRIAFTGDANPGNNDARNNFVEVPLELGRTSSLRFILPNPSPRAVRGTLRLRGIPEGFNVDFGNFEPEEFTLEPGEHRLVEVQIVPPRAAPHGLPEGQVDLGLELDGELVGGVSFGVFDADHTGVLPTYPPSGGTLSPYLTGTYDLRPKRGTVLQLVNPTGLHRHVLVALFDADEKPRKCLRENLSPNDLVEIDLRRVLEGGYGVVKVVSRNAATGEPEPGVVGYQRGFARCFWCGWRLAAESPLQPVPAEVLKDDLPIILEACQ